MSGEGQSHFGSDGRPDTKAEEMASKLAVERDADPQVKTARQEGDAEAAAINVDRERRDPSFAATGQPPQVQEEGHEVPPGTAPEEQ